LFGNVKSKVKTISYFATYLGGHPRYASDEEISLYIHPTLLELAFKGHSILIPYSDIKSITNVNKGQVTDNSNIVTLGIMGLLMKRNVNGMAIEYDNDKETSKSETIALDFWGNARYAQPLIYDRMVNSQHVSPLPKSSNVDANQPIISIESKLSGNTMRKNQIIESNKDNDNVSKSKMPISIPSQPVNKIGQAPNKSPSNQIADSSATPLTTSNAAKMNNGELLQILKLRLVKGEISKEEYLELRKTIES
jgi:hypothetical protein